MNKQNVNGVSELKFAVVEHDNKVVAVFVDADDASDFAYDGCEVVELLDKIGYRHR